MFWLAFVNVTMQLDASSSVAQEQVSCPYDPDAMLRLDYRTFDRDMAVGWRAIGSKPACWRTAADLISRYIDAHKEELKRRHAVELLTWHEAQLRAFTGDYRRAALLMRMSIKPETGPSEARNWTAYARSWNEYVNATIAFIEGDRVRLERARMKLAELPTPPGYVPSGHGAARGWPENLDVVDNLASCFGLPYKTAYTCGRAEGGTRLKQ